MALAPIPYVAVTTGDSEDAPSGAIPIDLYGVEGGGEATVTSVNGETGDVVLDAEAVGAAEEEHTHAAADVTSGTFAAARIPAIAISGITGLQDILDDYETRIAALEADAE